MIDVLEKIDDLAGLNLGTDDENQSPESAAYKKRESALLALDIHHTEPVPAALTGSVGWSVQTGVTPEDALGRTSDVDCIPLKQEAISQIIEADLDLGEVQSPGWENRLHLLHMVIRGKEIEVQAVDYHDIANTLCLDIQEKIKMKTLQTFHVYKLLRKVVALIHIYSFSLEHEQENADVQKFRENIDSTLKKMGEKIQNVQYDGDEHYTSTQLKSTMIEKFDQLMKVYGV